MSERELVTIRKINDIRPIDGADAIEVATVDGWDVVVSKAENHKVGNLVVYFEIDSFLPRWNEFKFLEKNCLRKLGDKEGLRLRTIKLRGQVSQGLIMPLSALYDIGERLGWKKCVHIDEFCPGYLVNEKNYFIREGENVTDLLEVVKWDPPLPASLGGNAVGFFPQFIRKTDQDRIQNVFGKTYQKYANDTWEVSMKLDGSSFTAYWNDGKFGVCSRNIDLAESDENTFWQVAKKYNLPEILKDYDRNIAIQGELMGPGVQGNREKFPDHRLFVFSIFNINTQEYYSPVDAEELTSQLGLDYVPVIATTKFVFGDVKDFLTYAEGPSINHPIREGLVFKSLETPGVSFKVIANNFLLKEKD